jgi:hypothetical protein
MPSLKAAVMPRALRDQDDRSKSLEDVALADAKQTRLKLLCDLVFVCTSRSKDSPV